jgi:hypothetical protein
MMASLKEFLNEIEKEAAFQAQLPNIIGEVEDFIKMNEHLIRTDKLPSIAQLEKLRYYRDISGLIKYIIEQTEKKTHTPWSEKVRAKTESKPFWRYLLDEIRKYSNDISKVSFFVNTFIDEIKIKKATKDE